MTKTILRIPEVREEVVQKVVQDVDEDRSRLVAVCGELRKYIQTGTTEKRSAKKAQKMASPAPRPHQRLVDECAGDC